MTTELKEILDNFRKQDFKEVQKDFEKIFNKILGE